MVPIIILVAPSGSGKSSILRKIRQKKLCAFSISVTTRAPRKGEVDGQDYYFFDQERFSKYQNDQRFLETTSVCGHSYGTLIEEVNTLQGQSLPIVLELDVIGAQVARQFFSMTTVIMVAPPSLSCLMTRLKARGSERQEDLERRLAAASSEVRWGVAHADYIIINDQIDVAVSDFEAILRSQCLKTRYSVEKHQKTLEDFLSI
ncbi:guanylate kinase [Gammaproteobacteria bacterium]|nr:guanylate kinase [Gammaproteobacteria bacterium]